MIQHILSHQVPTVSTLVQDPVVDQFVDEAGPSSSRDTEIEKIIEEDEITDRPVSPTTVTQVPGIHPMTTRLQRGIRKPNPRHALLT